ncbi:MAG: rhomboid family intramembrane serine protease [Raineya sp.]
MTDIFSEFRNAFRKNHNGLMKLIVINIVVFLILAFFHVVLWLAGNNTVINNILNWVALSPNMMTFITRPWTILSYGFTHDLQDILHILFNMLILYFMGRLVQDYIGSHRLIGIYVWGVVFGAFFFFAFYNFIPLLAAHKDAARLIGASGGVYAVIVAAATIAPETMVMLFGIFPVRLKYIAWAAIFLSFLQLTGSNTGGNAAHLGGALLGYIFVVQLRKGKDLGKPINQFLNWWQSLFEPKPKMKLTYVKEKKQAVQTASQKQNKPEQIIASGAVPSQEELDMILDKILAKGYDSLTKEEKQKLFNASRQD